jgi:phosphoribosylamine--glycine ligase
MVTKQGPKVIEFNARLGDPEAQVILPRMKTDLLEVALAATEGKLRGYPVEWSNASCMGVVMASGGYPGDYQTGYSITGLDQVDKDVLLFHAGTRRANGRIVTDGGRVLTVVAMGSTLAQAQKKVYANVAKITFQHAHYRRDIAQRAVRAEV